MIVYKSNSAKVGDGLRITRVSENGQKLEVLTDNKAMTFAEIIIKGAAPPVEEPTDPVDPPTDSANSPNGTTITAEGQSLVYAGSTFTLAPAQDGRGLGIKMDEALLPETNSITELFVHDDKLFQAAWGKFWQHMGDSWGPELGIDPRKPVDPGVPAGDYPALPAGMKKPGEYKASANRWAAQWGVDELTFPSWFNGVHTHGDPALVNMRADGSAVLEAKYVGNDWHSGKLQMNKPTPSQGRWGFVASCEKPNAVCAMFLYENNIGSELDFEYTKRGNVYGWALAVHMPKQGGGMSHSTGSNFHFPMTQEEAKKPHLYEFDYDASGCRFYIDGNLVTTITPAQMDNGVIWKTDAKFEAFCSVEKHGGWAGHEYPAGTEGQMTVWGIKIP